MAFVPVRALEVLAWGKRVGVVAWDDRTRSYLFEYNPTWQASGVELAPISMPVRARRYSFASLPEATFHRLAPMLADSLPDDFGQSVLNAQLRRFDLILGPMHVIKGSGEWSLTWLLPTATTTRKTLVF